MILCDCTIPGDPIPKGRPRQGKGGHTYTPQRTIDAEEAVAWALRAAYSGKPTRELLTVTLAFRCATKRRTDIDNLAKLVLDAGNGVVWVDDQQVGRLIVDVARGVSDPSTVVIVETLRRGMLTR